MNSQENLSIQESIKKLWLRLMSDEQLKVVRPQWTAEGERLRKMREEMHISQMEIAQAIGVCIKTIRRLERGERIVRRPCVSKSYETGLECIALRRMARLEK